MVRRARASVKSLATREMTLDARRFGIAMRNDSAHRQDPA
jgi:hypothetical protein